MLGRPANSSQVPSHRVAAAGRAVTLNYWGIRPPHETGRPRIHRTLTTRMAAPAFSDLKWSHDSRVMIHGSRPLADHSRPSGDDTHEIAQPLPSQPAGTWPADNPPGLGPCIAAAASCGAPAAAPGPEPPAPCRSAAAGRERGSGEAERGRWRE
jgi:hypothetical protein